MSDVYIYADETGNLDYNADGKAGATPYFGFGTVTYAGPHGDALWRGMVLRADVGHKAGPGAGSARRGFHALNDSNRTRAEVFAEVATQGPRFDATLLYKENADADVKQRGEMYLYKLAWYLHLKDVITYVSSSGDRVFVIVATLGTAARATQARAALLDVCQMVRRDVILCQWDSATSWGLQVADYCLWATQRRESRGGGTWWQDYIRPLTRSVFFPWGYASTPLAWR